MNLEDYLEARFVEEAELAIAASEASFNGGSWQEIDIDGGTVPDFGATVSLPLRMAQHASYWDPDRVLAEVAAKRRIVNIYQTMYHDEGGHMYTALCSLAMPYVDRPDFQAEWRR